MLRGIASAFWTSRFLERALSSCFFGPVRLRRARVLLELRWALAEQVRAALGGVWATVFTSVCTISVCGVFESELYVPHDTPERIHRCRQCENEWQRAHSHRGRHRLEISSR